MADIELVIKIPEEVKNRLCFGVTYAEDIQTVCEALHNGTPLPKGHSFIAICDSDFPITEEVRQELKNTVFVGNEDCNYCFDMTEIIEAERKEEE